MASTTERAVVLTLAALIAVPFIMHHPIGVACTIAFVCGVLAMLDV
jgi:hypothetical protein